MCIAIIIFYSAGSMSQACSYAHNFIMHLMILNIEEWMCHNYFKFHYSFKFHFTTVITTFCKQISLLYRSIYADATLKLNFEKLNPTIFLTFNIE